MDPNFDRLRRAAGNWPTNRRFNDLRRRLYRSPDGKFLGVFKGIAESCGYGVCKTRVIGAVALLILACAFGASGLKVTLLVAGFFYLLMALLMQAPRRPGAVSLAKTSPADRNIPPPPVPPRGQTYYDHRPRVDLAQLDRQLDGLNRRIQRMETIVTDREYDWNRRMES